MLKSVAIILMSLALSGCLFSPTQYGSRGFVEPEESQYKLYLANCLSFSPELRVACKERGNPDVIQIGYSAGIFGWRDPIFLLRVGSFGRTSKVEKIPSKWVPYLNGQAGRVAAPRKVARKVTPEPRVQIKSLDYDPETRKGCIVVDFDEGCYSEARLWARENIETLARDKNVALRTGAIPAAAKFYLGAERVKGGNTLEIEFETE